MIRRSTRAFWPLALLVLVLSCRASGCRNKKAATAAAPPPGSPPYNVTVLMTPPPPQPTVTMWKGVTRAPALPE
jgi:hypothetical protein